MTLAAILVEQESADLLESYRAAPQALRAAVMVRLPRIEALLAQHPEVKDVFSAIKRA